MRDHAVDESDQATEQEQMMTEIAITKARQPYQHVPCMGACYNCGEPLSETRRWCDRDCRDDWEKRNGR